MSERNGEAKDEQAPALSGVFSQGILKDNPVLRQMLGLCSTLAITTAVTNGIGMGAATTFVLVCSGVVVSLLRRVIPTTVRLPAYITIVASFVTLVQMLVRAHAPALDESLGIYLPLIVVNCIVLGRAEAFASKSTPVRAAADGLGMGVGYTLALVLVSAIRELLGAGTLLGVRLLPPTVEPLLIMVTPAGGFATLSVVMAASIWLEQARQRRAGLAARPSRTAEEVCASCGLGCTTAGSECVGPDVGASLVRAEGALAGSGEGGEA